MKPTIERKLQSLLERYEELGALLSDADVIKDQNIFRDYSKEYAQIEPVVDAFRQYKDCLLSITSSEELLTESDVEMQALAEAELKVDLERKQQFERDIQLLLLPRDPHDESNIFLEIRAGAGGDEASIFSGDLYRMYSRFAENKHWQVELISQSLGEHGGYKEIILRIIGQGAYSIFKFESGVHRVQRVPTTETQGRIHTSTCTIAVLPEVDEIEAIDINPADLRIDTFRASGAGGQHIQKTPLSVLFIYQQVWLWNARMSAPSIKTGLARCLY
jgi:peptide chain release factor 1